MNCINLGAELPLDRARVGISRDLDQFVERSPELSKRRAAEPYRRALVGMYARLVATARDFGHDLGPRSGVEPAAPYPDAAAFRADLDRLDQSLRANGSTLIAKGRLRHLRHAVTAFGFHLASLDLRQNSEEHEQVLTELFRHATGQDYAAMNEDERRALLVAELGSNRPPALAVRVLFGADHERARDLPQRRRDPSPLRARSRSRTT